MNKLCCSLDTEFYCADCDKRFCSECIRSWWIATYPSYVTWKIAIQEGAAILKEKEGYHIRCPGCKKFSLRRRT